MQHMQAQQSRTLSDRQQRIYDFLREHPAGVLSSVTPDGEPHGSAVYFAVDDTFLITFLTRVRTRKHDNLQHNNRVMLTVFELRSQAVAQVNGRAFEIDDPYEVNAVAARIMESTVKTSESGIPPIAKLEAGPFTAFAIEPVQIRWTVYSRPGSGTPAQLFEVLEAAELHA